MRIKSNVRPGASILEFAIVAPLALLLLIGLLVGGMGMFRYQQTAVLARESTRALSVHGAQYAQETGNAAWTATDVYNNVIVPRSAGLDLSQLSYSVSWNTSNSPYHTVIQSGQVVPVYNTVTVVISYNWLPEAFLAGPLNLTSSATAVMSY